MNKYAYYLEMTKKIKSPFIIPKAFNYLKYRFFRKSPVVKYYTPQIASMMLINRCNLQCNYCGLVKDGTFKEPKVEMTLEMVKKIFSHKLFKNCLLIDLLGGEPLLCKDLIPIVKFLSKKGYLTNTSTNGLLLLNKIEELKESGITRINISVYPENFDLLKNSLSKINRIYQVHTSYVLTKTILENSPQSIFDVIDLTHSSGCKSLRFWMYRSLGKVANLEDIVIEDSSAYKEFKAKAMEKYSDFIVFPQVVSKCSEKKCTQLWQRVNTTPTGELGLCCGNLGSVRNRNLFSNNFEELYNCDQIVKLRKNLLDNSAPPLEACKNCNLLTEEGW